MTGPWTPQCATHFPAQLKAFQGPGLWLQWDRSAPRLGSPPPTCPPSIPAGPRRGWPQGNSLVGTAHFSGWHRIEGPDRQVQPVSYTAPGRQKASEVCTAAPTQNNACLCRWSPRSHPSTVLLHKDQSHGLGSESKLPSKCQRFLPFLSEGLNRVSGKTTDDSRSFG